LRKPYRNRWNQTWEASLWRVHFHLWLSILHGL
jgi:hypothetical protein